MLLNHARALAHEYVTRAGEQFHKTGAFTPEQAAYEDWEPVECVVEQPVAPADCGCGGADVTTEASATQEAQSDTKRSHNKRNVAPNDV